MAGMLSNTDDDWAAYRQKAAAQTSALNAAPYVLDPAQLSADPKANQNLLYGAAPSTSLPDAIVKGFRQFFGRDPSQEDVSHWANASTEFSMTPEQIYKAIGESSNDPRNAGLVAQYKTKGQTGGEPATPAATGLGFNSGIGRGFGMNSAIF